MERFLKNKILRFCEAAPFYVAFGSVLLAQSSPTVRQYATDDPLPQRAPRRLPPQRHADSAISAPLAGMIANDGGTALMPIWGVAGAAYIESSVQPSSQSGNTPTLPSGVSKVFVAPGGSWALAVQPGGPLGWFPFTKNVAGTITPLPDAITTPDFVSFSPTGACAVLYSQSAGSVTVLTGLNTVPQVSWQAGGLSAVQNIAISDDGSLALVLAQDGTVYLLASGQAPQTVFRGASNVGIAFLPQQTDNAVVADGSAATLTLLSNLTSSPSTQIIAANLNLGTGQTLVKVAGDGWAFISAVGASTAYAVNLASGEKQSASLPVSATRLDALLSPDAFVISAPPGEAAWILLKGADLQTVFARQVTLVPAAPTVAIAPAGVAQ